MSAPENLPQLSIAWNAETQMVQLGFDPDHFKTWDFILAVLDMARQNAEQMKELAKLAAMQQRAKAHQENQVLARALRNGGLASG
jgi:hypothetical protein